MKPAGRAPEVILFGLDGATFTLLDDLMARGIMPNLARFQAEGTRAPLLSTVPPLTPLAWSSLVTGRTPGQHGILGFMQYAGPNSTSVELVSSRQFKTETIWSMVNRHAKRAGSLNFVAHQPAPKIEGWVIPGWVSWRWMKRLSHPAGIIDHLKQNLGGFDVKKLAIDFEEERKSVVGAPMDDYRSWIWLHIERERQWFQVLRHMMAEDPADLVGVVFDGVDKLQHLLWYYLDPAVGQALSPANPEYFRIREMAWDYYRSVDDLLGQTLDLYGDRSTILICSDHGFTGTREIVYINSWLEKMGYLTWKPETEMAEDGSQELESGVYRSVGFDAAHTKAYALTASSNGIFINVKGRRDETGIPPQEYDRFRRELIDALLTKCVDPETGEPLITRVTTREEAFWGPNMQNAPDLTLELRDFGFVSVRRTNTVYAKRPLILGTHHPEGILLARGAGIRRNARIDPVWLVDIAPTALYAMGLDIPADLQGRVLEEIYTPEHLFAHRSTVGEQTEAAEPVPVPVGVPDEDVEIIEKMKALGYLE
ncbi:MAG TPA: alkaline phosphatase family protein [Bryobacteraceae bacterium]|jgi:predicted AlkP superfamily phosphohydrolase/phosphomutase